MRVVFRSKPKLIVALAMAVVAAMIGEVRASGPVELAVQGASSEGGSSQLVRGRPGRNIQFSLTGRARDQVVICDRNWNILDYYDLEFLANDPRIIRTRPTVRLPDGQTRCFPTIDAAFGRLVDGGYLCLFSGQNGMLLDYDPIVVR